jgi:7-dehydrocholesterol reductase
MDTSFFLWFKRTFIAFFFIAFCPPAVFIFWYTNMELGGSLTAFWDLAAQAGLMQTIGVIWNPVFFGTETAWKILATYAAFQLILMKLVPGKTFLGPVTPKGNIPVYKANGVPCFLITLFAYYVGAYVLEWFSPTLIYDQLGPMLGALNCFSLFFCLFLYFKGIFKPSSSDHGASGNPLFDYYWGTELYPRIFGFDVKMFTNCRFGMMSWSLIILSYAAKQHQLYGITDSMIVAVALQLIYIGKFFLWETGYLRSLDIMHDRAGFMICWGCLVWVPSVYTSPTLYLVKNPIHLGPFWSIAIFAAGAACILINYFADHQRQLVRATNGACFVWKRKPLTIEAFYTTQSGESKQTLLLASGWWGLSRHFHYIPEIAGAFFWSVPALFGNFLPYFYVVFLTIILVNRAYRHDERCALKYGDAWDEYSKKVPYRIIPYLY